MMIPAIDAYSFHRYFGEHYPGLEEPARERLTVEEFLDLAAKLGAGGVSLESCFFTDTSPPVLARLRNLLDDLGLERVWAWGHPRGLESGQSRKALEDLYHHMEVARELGAPVMRICAGGRGTRPATWKEHKAALVPMLEEAVKRAETAGVILAVENHIDLYADEIVELMEAVNSPFLGVCYDTANNLRMFEDPLEVARKLAPYTRATHVKDIVAYKGDPKTFGFWPSVPAGQGLIDIRAVIAELRKADYKGLLALEIDYLHPDYGTEAEAVARGMTFLKNVLAEERAA